jgi:Kef-type K+ transport system membrane component KefB
MYIVFLVAHSLLRWLVLFSLILGIITALSGVLRQRVYTQWDNRLREASVGFSHLQLILGFVLYFLLSPLTKSYLAKGTQTIYEIWFFGIYHFLMMFLAIMLLSIGSSIIKQNSNHRAKFVNTLIYFCAALLIICLALPWFRPYLRNIL